MPFHSSYAAERILQGPHDVRPDSSDALQFLCEAEMGDGWLHPNSSNYTFVVELVWGECRGFGVYKPRVGEAPLWDFPPGTLYQRECAAFELSRLLGWGMVPPTVLREGAAGPGSLQLYVPPVEDSNYFTLRDAHREDAIRMAVFDIAANNADRKGGHCFVAECGGVWGIDHGLTFNADHKLRTVIWDFAGEQVPQALLDDLCGLEHAFQAQGMLALGRLPELLHPQELEALSRRIRALAETPVFPVPTNRRDIPWPWL
ncbi:MAG: SCO1664 family protein [Dehalococcoidia bacterium]